MKLGIYSVQRCNCYCNMLTTLIRAAKKNYFESTFDRLRNDAKKSWDLINTSLRPGGKKRTSLKKLIRNGETITDTQQIANALNLHFSTIGVALRDALPQNNNIDFHTYLPPSNQQSIYLTPSTPIEVVNIIKKIKKQKS